MGEPYSCSINSRVTARNEKTKDIDCDQIYERYKKETYVIFYRVIGV